MSGSVWAQLQRARTLIELRREDEARALLTEALATDPNNALAHALMASTLGDDRQAALHHADRAVALEPDSAQMHQVAAFANSAAGKHSRAIQHAHRMVELRPDSSGAHSTLAQTICSQNPRGGATVKEACSAADRAIELDPTDETAWYAKARTKLLVDDLPGARSAARKALEIDPHLAEAQRLLAALDSHGGRIVPAMTMLQSLVRADPSDTRSVEALDRIMSDVLSDLLWAGLVIGLVLFFAVAAATGKI